MQLIHSFEYFCGCFESVLREQIDEQRKACSFFWYAFFFNIFWSLVLDELLGFWFVSCSFSSTSWFCFVLSELGV